MSIPESSRRDRGLRPWRHLFPVLLGLCVVAACDGGGESNGGPRSPTVENAIQDMEATAGGDVLEIDLQSVFSAPSQTEVSFSASSSNPDAATVSLQNALLSVTPVEGGEATITATAENEAGTAEDTFVVTVFADPPGRP